MDVDAIMQRYDGEPGAFRSLTVNAALRKSVRIIKQNAEDGSPDDG
jgi:hypothetical protein